MTLKPPRVRFHHLKAMERNPRLARLKLEEGDTEDPTYAIERGLGCHAMVFGTQRVAAYEGKVRRGKEWDAFEAENQDALILTAAEYEKAQRMAEAVLFDPLAGPLLQGCAFEETLLFTLEGRGCRVTPDVRGQGYVADLKTTRSAKPEEFLRDAHFRRYHGQVAWQRLGVELALGARPADGYIIAVESAAPWAVTVVHLSDRRLAEGERFCREQLAKLIECETRNVWPSYSNGIVDWDMPEEGVTFAAPAFDDEQAA